MDNWTDFISTFWKGPSWMPGSSRTGKELDSNYVSGPRERIKANASFATDCYVFVHLIVAVLLLSGLTAHLGTSVFVFTAYSLFILAVLTNVGIIYEGKSVAAKIELYRCLVGLLLSVTVPVTTGMTHLFLLSLYLISLVIWFSPKRMHEVKLGLEEEVKNGMKEE